MFRFLTVVFSLFVAVAARAESFVEFRFAAPASEKGANPFAREISADVRLPRGATQRVPAFFHGKGDYAVRVCAAQPGEYVLEKVVEIRAGAETEVPLQVRGKRARRVTQPNSRSFVRLDPKNRQRFVFDDGRTYLPVGMNLAWAEGRESVVKFYDRSFAAMGAEKLNWTRVWMAHWGGLNLDWVQPTGASPAPGELDLHVAERWDDVLAAAEANGVYVQVVLQHHGQFSTKVNPNWATHPWNAVNRGGFLPSPVDFFTSEEARRFTKRKYRYIVARWGYSPAVLAWELFNEVHFTDALHGEQPIEAAVAAWHAEMAAHLRELDVHRHLVTTSADDLAGSSYAKMDYLQPHVYAPHMLANVRLHPHLPVDETRAVFYGEHGDERMVITPEQSASGVALVPPVWASLGGRSTHPGQTWFGTRIFQANRLRELGAVARILTETGFATQAGLTAFDVPVASDDRVPLKLLPGQWWAKRPNPEVVVPVDGREPADYGNIPAMLVGKAESIAEGYPSQVSFHTEFPENRLARVRFVTAGPAGAMVNVRVDGSIAATHTWPSRLPPGQEAPAQGQAFAPVPAELTVELAKGKHAVTVQNVGGPDVAQLETVDFGLLVPRLAAVGRRNERFVFLWVWNREGVFSVPDVRPAEAKLQVEGVAAGPWRVTWWDSVRGVKMEERELAHAGGVLELPTPKVVRHCVGVLKAL